MFRYFSVAIVAAALGVATCQAQGIVPVNHGSHSHAVVVEGGACATGQCGACSECLRITDTRTTKVPVYDCKCKEICIPNCFPCSLFGGSNGCKKIVVHQLVKKYRTDEECVTKCVTPEEAAHIYEAQAKKAAEHQQYVPAPAPAPTPVPARIPAGAVSYQGEATIPVSGTPQRLVPGSPYANGRN